MVSGGFHYNLDRYKDKLKIEKAIENNKYNYLCKFKKLSIVAPSQWLLNQSQNYRTFQDRLHTRIFNTLNLMVYKLSDKKYARNILNLPNDKKIIVFSASRISDYRKGMDLLIQSLNSIEDSDIYLVAVGKGLKEANIKHSFIELGYLNDEYSMSLIYAAADISVLPSREDNMPNAIIENHST